MARGNHWAGRWRAGLVALAALVAVSYLLYRESPYLVAVREIAVAQEEYRRRSLAPGGTARYGTRDELIAAGLLRPASWAESSPAEDAPSERWWAVAGPSHPLTGRFYYTDQSGVVYRSWHPIAPRIDRTTGTPPAGLELVERP